jgi:hypothetical protein
MTNFKLTRLAKSRTFKHTLIIFSYGLMALVFTYPLVTHFGDGLLGKNLDTWQNLWNLVWFKDALFSFRNPFFTDNLYYPLGTTLYFHTLSPVTGLLSLPAQLIAGKFAGYNFAVLASFALSGYAVWLLARETGSNQTGAYLGGFIFAFSPYKMAQLLDHLFLASPQWLAFYIYFLYRLLKEPAQKIDRRYLFQHQWKLLVGASVFLALNIYNDWYYTFMALVFTGLAVAWQIIVSHKNWLHWLKAAALAAGGGLLLGAPLIIMMFITARSAPPLTFPKKEAYEYSADLFAYLLPSALHPLWGEAMNDNFPAFARGALSEKVVFLGYLTMVLTVISCWKNLRRVWFWLVTLFVFMLLSLGPALKVNGDYGPIMKDRFIVLPFNLLNESPLGGFIRVPSRFTVLVVLIAAILAGLGFSRLSGNWSVKKQSFGLAAALLLVGFEFWCAPYPISNTAVPPAYQEIAADNGVKDIIELPIQKSGWNYPRRMYYQTVTGKKVVLGYTSRTESWPLPATSMPGLRQILYGNLQPDITYTDSIQAARAFFDYYSFGYIVVDKNEAGQKLQDNLAAIIGRLYPDTVKLEYPDSPIYSYKLPIGSPVQSLTAPLALAAEGWYETETNQRGQYRWLGSYGKLLVLVPENGGQNLRLKISGLAFQQPRQLALLDEAEKELTRLAVSQDETVLVSEPFNLKPGANMLKLVSLDGTTSPANQNKESSDTRQLSVLLYSLNIVN